MSQPQPDAGTLRTVSVFRRYVDQLPTADPFRHAATNWHLTALARLAVRTQQPRPRDVEVTNRQPVGPDAGVALNDTELQVLELLPTVLETEQIAGALGLTKGQVQRVQKSLHRVLGSQTRHRTVAIGVERGLLRLDGAVWRAVRASGAVSGAPAGDSLSVASAGLLGASGAVAS